MEFPVNSGMTEEQFTSSVICPQMVATQGLCIGRKCAAFRGSGWRGFIEEYPGQPEDDMKSLPRTVSCGLLP